MASTSRTREIVTYDEKKTEQLYRLCILSGALKEACNARNNVEYLSGDGSAGNESLSFFEKFLCKMAYFCDTQKGGKTITSLVCLRHKDGPEYLFTSNYRNESDLARTKETLLELLEYVSENPDDLEVKALHKQVLWRMLEPGFNRVSFYVQALRQSLDGCMDEISGPKATQETELTHNLDVLKKHVDFPLDMSSTEASRSNFLRNCGALINIAQDMKAKGFQKELDKHANDCQANTQYQWQQIRHYLGRMQSYRQAADIFVAASMDMPELFEKPKVSYVMSAKPKRIVLPRDKSARDTARLSFPDLDPEYFEADIQELEQYGFNQNLQEQLAEKSIRTMVHSEVQLHNHLISTGKIRRSDYWNDNIFIATSKPLCKLCRFYFSDSDFRVQSSHLNLYPAWRLPDVYEDQGPEIQEGVVEHMVDVTEQLREDARKTLKDKMIDWRRNDSRTDSHGISSNSRILTSRAAYISQGCSNATRRASTGEEASCIDDTAAPTPPHGNEVGWDIIRSEIM